MLIVLFFCLASVSRYFLYNAVGAIESQLACLAKVGDAFLSVAGRNTCQAAIIESLCKALIDGDGSCEVVYCKRIILIVKVCAATVIIEILVVADELDGVRKVCHHGHKCKMCATCANRQAVLRRRRLKRSRCIEHALHHLTVSTLPKGKYGSGIN